MSLLAQQVHWQTTEINSNLCLYRRCHGLHSNRTPPKYKSEAELLGFSGVIRVKTHGDWTRVGQGASRPPCLTRDQSKPWSNSVNISTYPSQVRTKYKLQPLQSAKRLGSPVTVIITLTFRTSINTSWQMNREGGRCSKASSNTQWILPSHITWTHKCKFQNLHSRGRRRS